MDILKKELLKEIENFIERGILTTKLFQKQFNIEDTPLKHVKRHSKHKGIIPIKGELSYKKGKIIYQFHGQGCEFIFPDNRIVDISYQQPNWTYDKRISFYRIWKFVKTNISEFENKQSLQAYLNKLEEEKYILPIVPPIEVQLTIKNDKLFKIGHKSYVLNNLTKNKLL